MYFKRYLKRFFQLFTYKVVAYPLIIVLLLSFLGYIIFLIIDENVIREGNFEKKARIQLEEVDRQFLSLDKQDTNRGDNMIVWKRTDGTFCQSTFIEDEIIYPPLDCWIPNP